MLPSTITLKRAAGDAEVAVVALGATEVPSHKGGDYAHEIASDYGWDGHSRDKVEPFLASWKLPAKVKEIADRCEQVLADGIPDQKRRMLRNQEDGFLDDMWITDIAIGEDVERPYQRWSQRKSGETRVAICIDAAVACLQNADLLRSRMAIAAGLASALEGLDYEVSIVAAAAQCSLESGRGYHCKPRQVAAKHASVLATVCKDENEPFVDSGFAHIADTGLRRLMTCWSLKDNGYTTHLTNSEWRELTGADLMVFVGPKASGYGIINDEGKPRSEPIGPVGDDTLRLKVDGMRDIDPAVESLESFFIAMCGEE